MTDDRQISGWLRVLALLLVVWEPAGFAMSAAGAMNALAVRGIAVALVLLARLVPTALSVEAGLALLDGRRSGVLLACVALPLSACVQLLAAVTRYFPSNRMPGDTPFYTALTIAYYGGWLLYLARSRKARALSG